MVTELSTGVKVAVVAAVIGVLYWVNQHYIVNPAVNAETSRWQQKWDARDKADTAAALMQETKNREREQSLQAAANAEQQKADAERKRLDRIASDARASSERLQQGVSAAIDAIGKGDSTAGASASGKTTRSTGLLLAELYRSIDEAAGRYADIADRSRQAGLTCERLYDNAKK